MRALCYSTGHCTVLSGGDWIGALRRRRTGSRTRRAGRGKALEFCHENPLQELFVLLLVLRDII